MLCQVCSKNQATTHIKTIINGELKEYMLCSECAQKMGYENFFSGFQMNLNNFLSSFLGESNFPEPQENVLRCKRCGSSFADIAKSGMVGCADCYTTFYDRMMPSIQRMHGNTTHVGKVPACAGEKRKRKNELEKMRGQLTEAVQLQEYEKAAQLRDMIKEMEASNHE